MDKTLTQNKLIKFLYKETSVKEYLDTLEAIENSSDVKREFESLETSKDYLDKMEISPSNKSIQNILRESRLNTEELV